MLLRILISLILVLCISACSTVSKQPGLGREQQALVSGWKFYFGEAPAQVTDPLYDDSNWTQVEVPHSWNRVGYYTSDLASHIHTSENVNNRMGVGWYRLNFSTPENSSNKRVWMEFDAVSRTAEVWVNGVNVGEHRGGFNRFRFDVTEFLNPAGDNNLLVVKADNSRPEPGSTTRDTLPIAGDFFVHGGIYRPVRLVVSDPVHLDLLDYGGPGVYATTTSIDTAAAEVEVRSRVRNDSSSAQQIDVHSMLLDADGNRVAYVQRNLKLDSESGEEFSEQLKVNAPVLWQGVAQPYLYTLRVELTNSDGKLLDRLDQQYGLRRIEIDPEQGFLLNGKPTQLHGVGYHQDREGKGWAVNESDITEDIAIMREMGVNTVRLAHYPHGQPIHELANRYGIILWDEIPLVSSWSYEQEHIADNIALGENAKLQLRELIHQNFNHPSVAVWGIANEVDFGALLPAFLAGQPGDPTLLEPLLEDLAQIVKEEDPYRYSTMANCCEGREGLGNESFPVTTHLADLAGVNRYYGWYYGTPFELDAHLDYLREIRPGQPVSVSEYGAGGDVTMHTDNPLGGIVDSRGRIQPEEYMSWVHEENWRILETKPYLWGIWIWNGFDFATTTRREGDSVDINTKGLVSYDRAIKKDSFYFYKANWSEQPVVYITGRRYSKRAYPTTDVRVYSNVGTTELTVNGISLGAQSECPLKICVWESVALQSGNNVIRAEGWTGSTRMQDEVTWQLAPQLQHAYHIDSGALMGAGSAEAMFGSDDFFFGGKAMTADIPGGFDSEPELAVIMGNEDREVMATYREGEFTYHLPVSAGQYNMVLSFMEPTLSTGERIFDVMANDQILLKNFDVAAAAEGQLREVSRNFTVSAGESGISLEFKPVLGKALISGLRVDLIEE